MNIKIVKPNQISIAYVPNVTDIIELPNCTRIVGQIICDCCGHAEEVFVDAEPDDAIYFTQYTSEPNKIKTTKLPARLTVTLELDGTGRVCSGTYSIEEDINDGK